MHRQATVDAYHRNMYRRYTAVSIDTHDNTSQHTPGRLTNLLSFLPIPPYPSLPLPPYPMHQAMMNSMMSNPELLRGIIGSNPAMREVSARRLIP